MKKKTAKKKARKKPYRWPHPFGKLKTPKGAKVQDSGAVMEDDFPVTWEDYEYDADKGIRI